MLEISEWEESLGRRLSRIRKKKEYTQAELAEKTGIIQRILSDYGWIQVEVHHPKSWKLVINKTILYKFERLAKV